jgi:hypothetical protein
VVTGDDLAEGGTRRHASLVEAQGRVLVRLATLVDLTFTPLSAAATIHSVRFHILTRAPPAAN